MTAWIFDVDGVITNPSEKRITQLKILNHLVQKLGNGEPIALASGRSLVWIIEKVLNPLIEIVKDKKVLQNLFVLGEKGATWIVFDKRGKMKQDKNNLISVPYFLQEKVRNLIKTNFPGSMFSDETKETMISTEMRDDYEVFEYKKDQDVLVRKLRELLDKEGLSEQLKIDPTTIAVDIQNKTVGKDFTIEKILNWLDKKGVQPQKFIVFGDSLSDLPMGERLRKKGLAVDFVFVGDKKLLEGKIYPFPITFTNDHFEKGTVEYLKNL